MPEEQALHKDMDIDRFLATRGEATEGLAPHRLANLGKLYHVPVFAVRELLESRAEGRKYGHLTQADLVVKADEMESVTEEDIEDLYENYRYGRRLSFYLYLLPSGLGKPDLDELQATLHEFTTRDASTHQGNANRETMYESTLLPNRVTLLDEEELEGFGEIRFRYFVTHRFLNVDEQPDEILQSRYGFLWLDFDLGYLAILSRDERVNRLLTRALAKNLQAIPLPIRFPREVLDQHFSIETAKRLSYYDPGTGVRRSISGRGLWQRFKKEILAREQEYIRPSSLYDEEVAEGVISGLGVASSKGKIYLTRTLPTSVVRNWARMRLPDLMRDVKELRERQPTTFSRSTDTVNHMRLPAAGRASINIIVEGLLQIERDEASSVDLIQTAREIYEALSGKYFSPYLRTLCDKCEEIAELCPQCESQEIEVGQTAAACATCGAALTDDQEFVSLRCMNGHITVVPLEEAWNIAPNHWLQKRMARIFAEVGQVWDEKNDYFHIEGSTLHRMRRGTLNRECLPQVIQNYISNFWDPVTGQVHAGSGNIVVGSPVWETSVQEMPDLELEDAPKTHHPAIRLFKSFDVQIRGDAIGGYTVEATVSDGPSVPPQPFTMPSDESFQLRLDTILYQSTSNGDIQATGEALFKAMFPEQIRRLWADAVDELREGEGLRVTLHIDPPELATLPWELLYEGDFIGLYPRFPIVRALDLPTSTAPAPLRPPIRVLAVISQQSDGDSRRAEAELDSLRAVLAQFSDKIELSILENARQGEVLAQIGNGYHVLHYIGKAIYQDNEGYLVLQDTAEGPLVSATMLGQEISGSELRLVVLGANERSMAEPVSALGSVAPQLVKAGVPAVIAMQLTPEDDTGMAFNNGFYRSLGAGRPVHVAMQDGRSSILSVLANDSSRSVDWALPTLYMRTPDGVILGIQERELDAIMKRRDELRPTVTYTPTFHGPVHGPVHTGSGDQRIDTIQYGLDASDLEGLFEALARLVQEESPPDLRDEALQEVNLLKDAIEEPEPDLGKIESVLNWFKNNIPQLAGAVASVILNPIVGKVVEAAGDLAVAEFLRRFGG